MIVERINQMADKTLEGFRFSFDRIKEAEHDLDLQISALEAHIDKYVRKIELDGHPIVAYILQLTHKEEDLTKLSEALKRIAPYVSKLDDLNRRKNVFDLATKDPSWMAWAFGDFTNELE